MAPPDTGRSRRANGPRPVLSGALPRVHFEQRREEQ